MMKQGKVWGMTEAVFGDEMNFSVHYLHIDAGGYCSEHRHAQKANVFYVLEGRLEVYVWPPGRDIPDTTILHRGEETFIPPGAWHMFKALENTECLEIYCGRIIGDDIERRTTGGRS
ncbi:MAG: cupin domain-containing protein [Candidatus Omnitrophota bacterium]|jgi:quercetin dioxygenase-like cupin family protein|nr:cupin domain-containing protein [Sphaerochaeta sp.]